MFTVVQSDRPSINRRSSTRSANRNGDRPGGHRDERVRLGGIGPAHRQRELPAIPVEEEHPILRPRLPNRQEHELSARPRMERVRHPNNSLITDRIKRS